MPLNALYTFTHSSIKKKNNRYFLLENIFSEEERRTRSENGTVSDWGDEICNKRLDKSLGSPS